MSDLVSEADFQGTVVEYARLLGWTVFHPFDSRRSTPGFPDLTCVRDGRLVFLELKGESGRLSAPQVEWLTALAEVEGVDAVMARPSDWPLVERLLA